MYVSIFVSTHWLKYIITSTSLRIISTPTVISTTNSFYPSGRSEGDIPYQLQPNDLAPPFIPTQPFPVFGTSYTIFFVSALPSVLYTV